MIKTTKFVIVIILVLLFTVSCKSHTNEVNETSNTTLPQSLNKPSKILNIYNFSIEKETELPSFTSLIKERYDIDLKFHRIGEITETIVVAALDGLLLYPTGNIQLQMDDKENKYYKLNNFLKDNEVFNMLPKQYRKSLEDENGDIWYLPSQQVFHLDRRIYNESIMDTYNFDIPTTVEKLLKLFVDVRMEFSGSEFSIMEITSDRCLQEMKDILEFHGLTIFNTNTSFSGIIGWNEEKQRFEDTIYNLDNTELFDMISYMKTFSLFDVLSEGNTKKPLNDENVFSIFTAPNRSYKYMSGPLHNRKEYIFSNYSKSIFLPLGTNKPKETLNLFIYTFFGSNEGNIYGLYGESGKMATYDSTFSQVNLLPYDKVSLNADGTPYFIALVGPWLYNDYIIYSERVDESANEKRNQEKASFKSQLIKSFNENTIEVLAQYKNLRVNGRDPNTNLNYSLDNDIFRNMFYQYLCEDIGAENFIEEYIIRMKKTGIEEFINIRNEFINASSDFYY